MSIEIKNEIQLEIAHVLLRDLRRFRANVDDARTKLD
jgi:hypothetical protein